MQDRQPGAPGQYKATVTAAELQKMQAGKQFSITMVRDDKPIVEGTPYNKAAVLPDALAKVICPDVLNPAPADAFAALQENKAPAGFGLGAGAPYGSYPDTVFNGGFYRWDADNDQTPFGNASMLVLPRAKDTSAAQFAICHTGTAADVKGSMAFRTIAANAVGEWAYINPPMALGVEYRTMERWLGKAVYTKTIDFGTLPNASEKIVSHATGATAALRAAGVTKGGIMLPYKRADGKEIFVSADINSVIICTNYDASGMSAIVQIWYTKD